MHRLSARLIHLPHGILADFAAASVGEPPDEVLKFANELIVQYTRVDNQLMERVMLDPDLISRIIQTGLDLSNVSSALTCQAWSLAWTEEFARRRVLRPLNNLPALDFDTVAADSDGPEDRKDFAGGLSNVTALDDERLCFRSSTGVHVVDRNMRKLATIKEAIHEDLPHSDVLIVRSTGPQTLVWGLPCALPDSNLARSSPSRTTGVQWQVAVRGARGVDGSRDPAPAAVPGHLLGARHVQRQRPTDRG